jgi:hypothetical protein
MNRYLKNKKLRFERLGNLNTGKNGNRGKNG